MASGKVSRSAFAAPQDAGAIEGLDADGLVVPLPEVVAAAAEKHHLRRMLEGICVGDTFTVFDKAQFELLDFRSVSYSVRMAAIQERLPQPDPHLPIAETAVGITAKVEMLQRLRAAEKVGIVLRKVSCKRMEIRVTERAGFPCSARRGAKLLRIWYQAE